jgi:hypothetical protein
VCRLILHRTWDFAGASDCRSSLDRKKSGPIAGATVQKRQRVGMSGKAMQRTDPPAGPAESEKSRTESEGQARPLFLLGGGALAQPKMPAPQPKLQVASKSLQTQVLIGILRLGCRAPAPTRPGQNHAHSCTLAAGHYSAQGKSDQVAVTNCPRRFAVCLAGNDRAARAH